MVTPALLPLLPAVAIVIVRTKAHAHPSHRRYALHAEVRLISGIGRYVRNLNMAWASAAVDNLVSDILREHRHKIIEHTTLR